jgi:hypothetical protein
VAAVTRSPKVRTQLGRNAGAGLCRSAFYCEIAVAEFDRAFDNRFTATYRFGQPPKISFNGGTERIAGSSPAMSFLPQQAKNNDEARGEDGSSA